MFLRFKIWFRNHKKTILLSVIGVLIILLSYALGYITARDFTNAPIIIQKHTQ
jgi:hypothetical protein